MNQTNLIRFYELDNRKSKFEANKNKQDGQIMRFIMI